MFITYDQCFCGRLFPCTHGFTYVMSTPGCFGKEVSTLATSTAVFSLMIVVNGLLQKRLCLKGVSVLPGLSAPPFIFVTHLSVVAANIVEHRIFLSSVKLKWITMEVNLVYNTPKRPMELHRTAFCTSVQPLPLACSLRPPGCLKQSLTSWFCFAVVLLWLRASSH